MLISVVQLFYRKETKVLSIEIFRRREAEVQRSRAVSFFIATQKKVSYKYKTII